MTRQRAGTAISSAPPAVPAHSEQSSSLVLSVISPEPHSNPERARKSDLGAKVFTFPTVGKDGQWWSIREKQDRELRAAFPNLNVAGEYTKILVWLNANPPKRKTARGMMAFLFRWFDRAQNRPSAPAPAVPFAVRAEREREDRILDEQTERIFGGGR